jgi:threonine aldolase
MIDLRSDTCSRPTASMRCAMADAVVGDDVYSDDPAVRTLEERAAALLGKEDAVFMVTGTMTNQVAIRAHTEAASRLRNLRNLRNLRDLRAP